MYPYDDNNQYHNTPPGWDQQSGTYHYSYRQPTQPAAPAPTPQPPKKKRGGALKIIALVLCCALAGGGAGVGGAALFSALSPKAPVSAPAQQAPDTADSGSGSTIYRDDTGHAPVNVVQANGVREMSLSEIYAAYADSCVCVTVQVPVQSNYYYQQERMMTGAGSGFIISEDGYIVTNYHVIEGATAIRVMLNSGEAYDAKLVGGEKLDDVAVLKVDNVSGLKPVVLGDSDALVVGEQVSTIGNALGSYSFSQTSGHVSGVGRAVTMSDGTIMNMIQTDCTINSGNSGGPLFDQYGRVVGITSAKLSNNGSYTGEAAIEGMGFAIPLNDVISIITDYMEHGYVTGRPSMGITGFTVEDSDRQRFGWPAGAYVSTVEDGSCAQKAGLRPGDIIIKLGDKEVSNFNELAAAKNRHRAGDTVDIVVWRNGEEITLSITFDEQVNDPQEQQPANQQPQQQPNNGGNNNGGYYFDPWEFFFGNGW